MESDREKLDFLGMRVKSRRTGAALAALAAFLCATEGHVTTMIAPKRLTFEQMARESDLVVIAELAAPPFVEAPAGQRPETRSGDFYRFAKIRYWNLRDVRIVREPKAMRKSLHDGDPIRVIKELVLEIVDPKRYEGARSLGLAPPNPMPGEATPDYYGDAALQSALPAGKPLLLFLKRSDPGDPREFRLVCVNAFADAVDAAKLRRR